MIPLLLAISIVVVPAAGYAHVGGAGPLTVRTDDGVVIGVRSSSMREFLGVPYAQPPVGRLRWMPPEPAKPWTTPLQASHFGQHCPQNASPFGMASTSEDCLYLNVFAPQRAGRYPVMVWIYGGALDAGESDNYDPTGLVRHGVIVVTINYRIGILGFLASSALSAESPNRTSGDYGLMDQQAALQWVQSNIANFGGDPRNITIFGESAGGLSVLSQLVNPVSRQEHLFQKAIVESGSYTFAAPQPTLQQAEAVGDQFAVAEGCTNPVASVVAACLRGLSVGQIIDSPFNSGQGAGGFVPNTGTPIVPMSVATALETGQFYQVPTIEGTNRNEWRLFVALEFDLAQGKPLTAAGYIPGAIESTLNVPEPVAEVIAQEYPLADFPSPDLALSAVGTDAIFACSGRTEVGLLAKYAPTYAYEFNDPNAPELFLPPVSFTYASAHASELQYLFHLTGTLNTIALSESQKRLSRAMIQYWAEFAKTGSPNSVSSFGRTTFWPVYDSRFSGKNYLSLTPPTPRVLPDASFAQEHNCGFWSTLSGQ
ncbi:MAG: carboxylesterase/lipase family protein [Rhodanobacteraceae bacterium]